MAASRKALSQWAEASGASAELTSEIGEFLATWFRTSQYTLVRFHTLNPEFLRESIGYIPQSFNKDARSWVNRIASEVGGAVDPALAKTDYGAHLLSRILNAVGGGASTDAALGASTHAMAKKFGKGTFVHFAAEGEVLFVNPQMLARDAGNLISNDALREASRGGDEFLALLEQVNPNSYAGAVAMNDATEGLVKQLADEYGIALPKETGARLFEEDPFKLANNYIRDMDRTFREQVMLA